MKIPNTKKTPPQFPCFIHVHGSNEAGNLWDHWTHCENEGVMHYCHRGDGSYVTEWSKTDPEKTNP